MLRRDFIGKTARSLLALIFARSPFRVSGRRALVVDPVSTQAEVLYNGITLPSPFPPIDEQPWSTDQVPYYIAERPPVIRIDIGRQLFVDDFLIDSMDGLERSFHEPEPYAGNPVFSPTDEDIHSRTDNEGFLVQTQLGCPFSDGVWWDPRVRKFRAWYLGGPNTLRLAESSDGLDWTRVGSDGVVMSIPPGRDSGTVWIDEEDPDPSRRYKMAFFTFADKKNWVHASADGIHWPPFDEPIVRSAYYSSNPDTPTGDRTTIFLNPFRKKWVWSLRDIRDRRDFGGLQYHRMRRYYEGDDLFEAASNLDQNVYWLEADAQDLQEAGPPGRPQQTIPQFYNIDGFAYESVMIFGLTVLSSNAWLDRRTGEAFPKRNEIYLGFSRDGFHMTRPMGEDRRPFLAIGPPESWNEGNVQTVGAGCVIVGEPEAESLQFYFSGRENELEQDGTLTRRGHLGCATLRRDGFASIGTDIGDGVFTTQPIRFDHPTGFLFVNCVTDEGVLRVEVLDEAGATISGFEREACVAIRVDSTKQAVTWEAGSSLARLSQIPFRLRFTLASGRLFSFWVSPTPAGASEGFLAAGGPRYDSYRDTSPPDTTATADDGPHAGVSATIAPNPFRSHAKVRYRLANPGDVSITVHDINGRSVRTLVDRFETAGDKVIHFHRETLASGVYFCHVRISGYTETLKVIILG